MESPSEDAGFTLVEVVVAAALLVVGVLGTVLLVDVGTRQSDVAAGRLAATNLMRQVLETARSLPAADLHDDRTVAALQAAAPDLADTVAGDTAWTVQRANRSFTLAVAVCQVDDPADGTADAAARTADFCSQPAASTPADLVPADAKRVRASVSWSSGGRARTVAGVVTLPVTLGDLPAVESVAMTAPFACTEGCTITSNVAGIGFAARTTLTPATVTWLRDFAPLGSCPPVGAGCAGSGRDWTYTWTVGVPVRDTSGLCLPGSYVYDGISGIGMRASDAFGRAQSPMSMPVSLNRCAPLRPFGVLATGRDTSTPVVDVEWEANPEGDIAGYRVYRGPSAASLTQICPATAGAVIPIGVARSCTDTSPPAYAPNATLNYYVVALDRDPAGALRQGAMTAIGANTGNRAPDRPQSFSATRVPEGVRLTWSLPSSPDPDNGDTIDGWRIYRRDGSVNGDPTYVNRLARLYVADTCVNGTCSYTDTTAGATTRTYSATSLDTHLRESAYTQPRTA